MENLAVIPQPLSALELREDHGRVRRLLRRFSVLYPVGERRDAMRLALDLFEVHTALERQLYTAAAPSGIDDAISGMMEQLEMTQPLGRLYLARGLELKHALEAYLAREEKARPEPRVDWDPMAEDRNLLSLRRNLVRETLRMLCVN